MKASDSQVKHRRARPRRLWAVAALLLLAGRATAEPRVLLISIDGARPDVMLRADMPVVRDMMARGAFTFWATTTPAAVTLPSHTSMLTGVTIERHGMSTNDDDAAAKTKILVPTIFDLAHEAGMRTAMVSGKSKFSLYAKSIDDLWCPDAIKGFKKVARGSTIPTLKAGTAEDNEVADHVIDLLKSDRPRLLFVHFAVNDVLGHGKGWGSRAQIDNLALTDKAIGRIFDALRSYGVFEETTVILSADHGGAGRQHGKDNDPSKFIPWIIAGPGVQKSLDLSLFRKRPIRTYDTFATACSVLGLTPASDIDGAVVTQAFEGTQLLNTVATSQPTTAPAKQPETHP